MKQSYQVRFPLALAILIVATFAVFGSDRLPAPLLEGLGDLQHPVTTRSSLAQRYFNQGIRLLFGFNHDESIRAFRSAAIQDPGCAMAHWGVAYAYGPHVNKSMAAEDTAHAWEALQKAKAAAGGASDREQAYIAALATRYQEAHQEDRSALDRAFADAMRDVSRRFPDDLDAQVLFAESLMNTMPWDYWTRDRSPKPETDEVLAALRRVLSRNPDHPGANHFYIHAVEAGPNPEWGLASADRLRNHAPTAGHLVHMPSHIYMRVGQYHDAVIANEKAVRADRDYLRRSRAQGFYPGAYYPHNQHFLWWALLFEGRSRESLEAARRTAAYAMDNACGPRKVLEAPRLRHLPGLTLVRFGRWDDVLRQAEPPATNDFLVDQAFWHFARGLARVAKSDVPGGRAELEALERLASGPEARDLSSPAFPVAETLAVAHHWLDARVAGAAGDTARMLSKLEQAVAAEDALAYMEPTYWPIPVRPTLGAALLRVGEPARAERVFREDLERWKRNPWGLFGLEKALRQQGRNTEADLVGREFQKAWKHADVTLTLDWF